MSQAHDLFDVNYNVPEVDDVNWGPTVTAILAFLMQGEDQNLFLLNGIPIPRLFSANITLSAGGTLTQTKLRHRVAGNGGPVTLSAVEAIADGAKDGALLILEGTSDTNTVTVLDGANTSLNGDAVLGQGDALSLCWDDTLGLWVELSRR